MEPEMPERPKPDFEGPDLMPRKAPGLEAPGPLGPETPEVPTDVNIDAATGEVSISKGPVKIRVAKYDPDSPPDKVKHLPEKSQRQWVHIYNSAVDDGDDEEAAHKKAWGAIPDKGKKNKGKDQEKKKSKVATHPKWIEYVLPARKLDYVEDPLGQDTHDEFGNIPRNRRKPPVVQVVATAENEQKARELSFALQMYTSLNTTAEGSKVTIEGVENPLGLLEELNQWGVEADVTGQNLPTLYPGRKVAVVGDFPAVNYYPNELTPLVKARFVEKTAQGLLFTNEMWGRFYLERGEYEPV